MVLMKAIVLASLRITKKEIFPMEPKNGANESNCLAPRRKPVVAMIRLTGENYLR
jgi:hypothetical protein